MEDAGPPFALADVLRWARYARKRDRHGADRCKEEWFGKERAELGLPNAAVAIKVADREIAAIQERGRAHLAEICRSCPLACSLAG